MKYYVFADIHGRHDLLVKAIDKITDVMEDGDKIITLGDYIDRGRQSRQVIETLMEYGKDPDFISLQGNHEDIAVQSISRQLKPSWWLGNGGNTTLESYGHPDIFRTDDNVYYSVIPDEHVKWMASLPLYYETEKQVFVHAGIPNDGPLDTMYKQLRSDGAIKMQWMLYGPSDHGGWKGKHIVHGHHQFADGPHTWYPGSKGGGRTNLDTWAYKTGRLVIGVFDDTQLHAKEFIEVTDEEPSSDSNTSLSETVA